MSRSTSTYSRGCTKRLTAPTSTLWSTTTDVPNVARRLIEAVLAFRFPDISGDLSKQLERVAFDSAKKTRILRLLHTYSHAGAIGDPEHDLSLLAETQPVLRDMLELMKAVDSSHYEGLERLVVRVNGDTGASASPTDEASRTLPPVKKERPAPGEPLLQ